MNAKTVWIAAGVAGIFVVLYFLFRRNPSTNYYGSTGIYRQPPGYYPSDVERGLHAGTGLVDSFAGLIGAFHNDGSNDNVVFADGGF